jgi:hypothetical protein
MTCFASYGASVNMSLFSQLSSSTAVVIIHIVLFAHVRIRQHNTSRHALAFVHHNFYNRTQVNWNEHHSTLTQAVDL